MDTKEIVKQIASSSRYQNLWATIYFHYYEDSQSSLHETDIELLRYYFGDPLPIPVPLSPDWVTSCIEEFDSEVQRATGKGACVAMGQPLYDALGTVYDMAEQMGSEEEEEECEGHTVGHEMLF